MSHNGYLFLIVLLLSVAAAYLRRPAEDLNRGRSD
jgi:hypothetical protein